MPRNLLYTSLRRIEDIIYSPSSSGRLFARDIPWPSGGNLSTYFRKQSRDNYTLLYDTQNSPCKYEYPTRCPILIRGLFWSHNNIYGIYMDGRLRCAVQRLLAFLFRFIIFYYLTANKTTNKIVVSVCLDFTRQSNPVLKYPPRALTKRLALLLWELAQYP